MQYLVILAIALGVANARVVKREAGAQTPPVWDALDQLRGKHLDTSDLQILAAVAGTDYPVLAEIPAAEAVCDAAKPGFYANVGAGKCQAFDRCDVNGNITSYLCPNMTLFNQITLICDHWYNVDCDKSATFKDYSNSRLYTDKPLLDDQKDKAPKPDAAAKPAEEAKPAEAKKAEAAKSTAKGDAIAAKTGAVKVSGSAESKGKSPTAKAPAKAAGREEGAPADAAPAEPAAAEAAAPAETPARR